VRGQSAYRLGARLRIRGLQGPGRAGKDYPRQRATELLLDPADADAMLTAYEQGGDRGFVDWATNYWGQEYLPDWGFQTVEEVDIQPLTRGGR
jgi:hypothetical protein